MPTTARMNPVAQAERARRVVAVLGQIEDRIVAGLDTGPRARTKRHGRLVTAFNEATAGTWPGVADQTAEELAARLPAPLRGLGRHRPGTALVVYDELVRDPCRVLALVRAAHRGAGGAPRHPSATFRRAPVELDRDLTDPR